MILKHDNNQDAIVGVFLGGKILHVGKVKNDRIVKSTTKTIDNFGTEEEVLNEVISAINEVFDDEVKGIGVGVPSLVDTENGIVYDVQHIPSWQEVHLKDILTDIYNVNVYVNNDANCFVVGEKYFGTASSKKNVVGLVISTGLGAGVIVDNKLYSGSNCGVGEIGMIPYKEHNIEYYVSSKSFLSKYDMDFKTLLNRAEEGNKIALRIFEQFGEDLAMVIQTTLFVYDPEMIIIGGSTAVAYSFYEKSMYKALQKFPYKKVIENLEIQVSANIEMPVLGAAALFYDARQKKFILN